MNSPDFFWPPQFRQSCQNYALSHLLPALSDLFLEPELHFSSLNPGLTARVCESFVQLTNDDGSPIPSSRWLLLEENTVIRLFWAPLALHIELQPKLHSFLAQKKLRKRLERAFYLGFLRAIALSHPIQIAQYKTIYQRKFIEGQGLQNLPKSKLPLVIAHQGQSFYLQRSLAQGSYSQLFLFKDLETEDYRVLKQFKPGTAWGLMQNEIRQHLSAQQEGISGQILSLEGFVYGDSLWSEVGELFLLLEYAKYGNLWQYRNQLWRLKSKGVLNQTLFLRLILFLMRRALRCLLYLHQEQGLVHLDFKPENLLILADGRIKLGDFGSAMPLAKLQKLKPPVDLPTTLPFKAPESQTGENLSEAYDLWGVGMSLTQLLTGNTDIISSPKQAPESAWIPPEIQTFIQRLLQPKPEARPSVSSLIHDPIFANPLIADKDLKALYILILQTQIWNKSTLEAIHAKAKILAEKPA